MIRKKCLNVILVCCGILVLIFIFYFSSGCAHQKSLWYDATTVKWTASCVPRAVFQAMTARRNGYEIRIALGKIVDKKYKHCQAQAKIDDAWYFLDSCYNKVFVGEQHKFYVIKRYVTLEEAITWIVRVQRKE